LLRNLVRACDRTNQSRSHPLMSVSLKPFAVTRLRRSPRHQLKIHERSTRATALYVCVRYMTRHGARRCDDASQSQFQIIDDSYGICASRGFRGCVTGPKYFLTHAAVAAAVHAVFLVPRNCHR
jgi:hypothetical protein